MIRAQKHVNFLALPARLLKPLIGPFVLAIGIFYFGFHALSGEHGLYALLKEERKLELVKGELEEVTASRKALEQDSRLLGDSSLDLDMLDERSRIILNNAAEDELVIPVTGAAAKSDSPAK